MVNKQASFESNKPLITPQEAERVGVGEQKEAKPPIGQVQVEQPVDASAEVQKIRSEISQMPDSEVSSQSSQIIPEKENFKPTDREGELSKRLADGSPEKIEELMG